MIPHNRKVNAVKRADDDKIAVVVTREEYDIIEKFRKTEILKYINALYQL